MVHDSITTLNLISGPMNKKCRFGAYYRSGSRATTPEDHRQVALIAFRSPRSIGTSPVLRISPPAALEGV